MTFNPDSKHAQESIFSRKIVVCANYQKHLGIFLNENLNFSYHIKGKMSKAMKGIGITEKLNKTHPWHSLITIYNVSHL